MMNTAEHIVPEGELGFRLLKNFARLEEKEYRPEVLFKIEKNGWPGDWEGRTILALVLLSGITGKKASYLDRILEKLEEEQNPLGFLKEIPAQGTAAEQQLSGHNWLLRGLTEHYLWSGCEKSACLAHGIVENLFLPVQRLYGKYPLRRRKHEEGQASGHTIAEAENGWFLSTDIGCAFMPLDGLSQYYEVFKDERTAGLLEEMGEQFCRLDFLGESVQTHAFLSACRGLLRYGQAAGKKKWIDTVSSFWELYQKNGMTENYANDNWFGRPYWTEPCAEVDSYILAIELWKETRRPSFLETAHRIYYNALCFAQRENGGFGCDGCTGEKISGGRFLRAQEKNYEAFWCCTMRGAEGLEKAARNMILTEGDTLWVTGYFEGEYSFIPKTKVTVQSSFPAEGRLKLNIEKNIRFSKVYIFLPENTFRGKISLLINGMSARINRRNGFLECGIFPGETEIILEWQIPFLKRDGVRPNASCHTYWHGLQLLGTEGKETAEIREEGVTPLGGGKYTDGLHLLEPVARSIYLKKEELLKHSWQILF